MQIQTKIYAYVYAGLLRLNKYFHNFIIISKKKGGNLNYLVKDSINNISQFLTPENHIIHRVYNIYIV
jgi:hypothetical protein